MKFGLDNSLIEAIISLAAKYETVKRIVIFGSRATGDYKEYSDIDLAIYCDSKFPTEFYFDLDEAAGIYKTDIVDMGNLHNSAMYKSIEEQGVEIYKR